jgi:predicted dehydrogenase
MALSDLSAVTVVGGGRWGQQICQVLDRILPAGFPVSLVSQRVSLDQLPGRVNLIKEPNGIPRPGACGAAVIATAPHDHVRSAGSLLAGGWHVLVEKPLALRIDDARTLVEQAARCDRHLWVGLVYLFAPYLAAIRPYAANARRWRIEWCDPAHEIRYGSVKRQSLHVSIVEDVFCHVWSILRAAGLDGPLRLESVQPAAAPSSALLILNGSKARIEVAIDRHAERRRRAIRVEDDDGHVYELDMTVEPGIMSMDGVSSSVALPWDSENRPLQRELGAFLATCGGAGVPNIPIRASDSLEAVALTEAATKRYLAAQARLIAWALEKGARVPWVDQVLLSALCREAALYDDTRFVEGTPDAAALVSAAHSALDGRGLDSDQIAGPLAAIILRSGFLAQVQQCRVSMSARPANQ